jgi:hypothetical protein
MKRTLLILLLAVAVLTVTVTPGYTGWRGGVYVGAGPYWGPTRTTIRRRTTTRRPPTSTVRPPWWSRSPGLCRAGARGAGADRAAYWYYCSSAKGYYPTVPSLRRGVGQVPEQPR